MTAPSYEQTVDVETPELVVLTYSIAGIGSRAMAAITDLLLVIGAFVVLGVIWFAVVATGGFGGFDLGGSWGIALLIIVQFALLWGYYVLFEGLMDGQTPGKRLHHIRVVREGGYSVTFGASAVRNLIRVLDMQPLFFYLVGMISVLATKRGRRLGDLVAGTIVVREDARRGAAVASAPAPATAEHASTLHTQLSEDEYVVLSRFVERWATLDGLKRAALAQQLAARLGTAVPDDGRPAGPRLLELHERERRARAGGVASRGEMGAGRERQALIAAGSPRWNAFASRLAQAQRRGLRSLGEEGVREFVAEYRALSADLARLRTASGGRALDELFQLGRLVAGAHNLLYRDRGMPLRATVRYLFTEGPREVRRSAGPIALAALLLFGPAIVAGVSVARTPTIAPQMLPAGMLRRAEDGVRRAKSGEGYIDDPQLFRPVMASGIIANNVQVTFATFAGGVTAGVMSVLVLVMNGVSMGSVVGLYASKGILPLLVAFVAPHGVLELFAICVAGGAAFLVAAGMLLPGARTRGRALVENGQRAIRLIGVSTMLLVVAGLLEGFVSPIEWWPIEGKLAVSGTTLVLLVSYLRGGRSVAAARERADDEPAATIHDAPSALALAPVTVPRAP
ncbi:MAG TPA: stage II sporulation protein M [Gemmatimonadaceae bacterium]|nr:stage II sporulation protein M [Gemmatimonadaceae bacterium]